MSSTAMCYSLRCLRDSGVVPSLVVGIGCFLAAILIVLRGIRAYRDPELRRETAALAVAGTVICVVLGSVTLVETYGDHRWFLEWAYRGPPPPEKPWWPNERRGGR